MATITFDTLKFVETLKSHGVPDDQAKGIAEAFKNATGEADLATKRDLEALETRLNGRFESLEYRLTIKLGSFIMLATGIIIAVFKL